MARILEFPSGRRLREDEEILTEPLPSVPNETDLSGLDREKLSELQATLRGVHTFRPHNNVLATYQTMVQCYTAGQLVGMVNDFEIRYVTARPHFYEAIVSEVQRRLAESEVT